jgi:hypothetical protein
VFYAYDVKKAKISDRNSVTVFRAFDAVTQISAAFDTLNEISGIGRMSRLAFL